MGLVPVGSFLTAILYYGVAREISQSPRTAAAVTLYATWYYPSLANQFSTNPFVWTNILFLSFVLILHRWLAIRTKAFSVLIAIFFAATFLHYHTTPLWMLAALATAVAGMKIRNRNSGDHQATISWSLPLACLIIYFTFDSVIYGVGLVRLHKETVSEALIESFASRIIGPLLSREHGMLGAFETVPLNPMVATWTTLLVFLLLMGVVGIWFAAKIHEVLISREIKNLVRTTDEIFVWSMIAAAIAHALVYSISGAVSLRVVPLAFPLILSPIAKSLGLAERVAPILALTLASFAVVGLISVAPTIMPDLLASQTGLAPTLVNDGDRVLADANVYASLLTNAAEDGKVLDLVWLDSDIYAALVGKNPVDRNAFDYLVIDSTGKPIVSADWVFLEPWTRHTAEIDQNSDLSRIYDSDNIAVFQSVGSELPGDQHISGNLGTASRPFPADVSHLFLAVVLLAFLPGATFTFIASNSSLLRIRDTATLLGLTIGTSVAFVTFIGYLANFSPLGLGWSVPLIVVIPFILLGAYLAVRRPQLRASSSWLARTSSLSCLLLIWSLISTVVAHERTRDRSGFIEFFVTQQYPGSETIVVNVVNREERSGEFALVVERDGVIYQTIGPKSMLPMSTWREELQLPTEITGYGRQVIRLVRDGDARWQLHLVPHAGQRN